MPSEKAGSKSKEKSALRYAAAGWRVLPIHTVRNGSCSCGNSCPQPGKHPATRHGVNDATTSRKEIKTWWSERPRANIGIAPGRNAGILVLDVDPHNGGDKSLARLQRKMGRLPNTVTANTGGGGQHLFFKHPRFKIRKDNAGKLIGRGVDVMTDGCYVVAPPSRHASGKRYTWVDGKSPTDIKLAKIPRAWCNLLRGDVADTSDHIDAKPATPGQVLQGQRNNHLTSLAGRFQRDNMSSEVILAALQKENELKCTPPLHASEIKQIVKSINRYPAVGDGADAAESLMRAVLARYFKCGKYLLRGSDGRFWRYNDKLWRPVTDDWVSGKVLKTIEANRIKGQRTSSLISQVLALLRAKLAVEDDPLSFAADPPPIINCANGELWIEDSGNFHLERHKADSHLHHCLDIEYDPRARCPEYDRAIREIFDAADDPEAMVRHWNELTGHLIQSRRNIPLIVILLGEGENGKTKLIETVNRLLGTDLVYARRVDELDKSRFSIGGLLGKYLFLDDDVRAGARLPDGTLKTISEAKQVTGELKYGPSFNFVVRTVPVLLCNNIPSLADLSHGMRRRLMVIPFDRKFTRKDRDRGIFDRIWKNELPGILNRALEGYRRVLRRQANFKRPHAVKAATSRWLQQANPLPAFIKAECLRDADASCLMSDFYKAYSKWTQSMGYTLTQNQQTVDRNLGYLKLATKKGNRGKKIIGLRLKEPASFSI